MGKSKFSLVLILMLMALSACDKKASTGAGATAPADAGGPAISFVDTQEGKPLVIDAKLFDTPAAKEFLATGKNPYIGNADAIAKGKKVFGLYSCTQCHGPEAKGQVGPGLVGPTFRYPKDATNKGMFETIWHGTNGGMGAKGLGLMDPTDPKNGITPDELLKVQAWIRSMGTGLTGNE
ncbi:c-type cytochrome [Methylotenera sp.]|uniref:c-type cytochrome n=1 Tax=Methylotenera sp. TaxID=2051956 RepID=UPI00248A828A|nr:c-type cytochrome [Methylotenera sp.]MDI1299259.1 c-type cytochrome [Methylotenera sp.]